MWKLEFPFGGGLRTLNFELCEKLKRLILIWSQFDINLCFPKAVHCMHSNNITCLTTVLCFSILLQWRNVFLYLRPWVVKESIAFQALNSLVRIWSPISLLAFYPIQYLTSQSSSIQNMARPSGLTGMTPVMVIWLIIFMPPQYTKPVQSLCITQCGMVEDILVLSLRLGPVDVQTLLTKYYLLKSSRTLRLVSSVWKLCTKIVCRKYIYKICFWKCELRLAKIRVSITVWKTRKDCSIIRHRIRNRQRYGEFTFW